MEDDEHCTALSIQQKWFKARGEEGLRARSPGVSKHNLCSILGGDGCQSIFDIAQRWSRTAMWKPTTFNLFGQMPTTAYSAWHKRPIFYKCMTQYAVTRRITSTLWGKKGVVCHAQNYLHSFSHMAIYPCTGTTEQIIVSAAWRKQLCLTSGKDRNKNGSSGWWTVQIDTKLHVL